MGPGAESGADLGLVSCNQCANTAFGVANNGHEVPLKFSWCYLKAQQGQEGHEHGLGVLKAKEATSSP